MADVATHSGGSGHRVGRHYDRSARCFAGLGQGRKPARPRKPGPELMRSEPPLQMPRWSAERRAPYVTGCDTPRKRVPGRVMARLECGDPHSGRLSALYSPRLGEGQRDGRRTRRLDKSGR